jgi:hypothetical protein
MTDKRVLAIGFGCALVAACGSDKIWNGSSKSIEVSCSSYSQGGMRFAATREQLSATQNDLASKMTTIEGASGCWSDVMSCSLSIAQGDGSTTMIDANETDSECGTGRKVSFATFDPFRRSLGCQFSLDLTTGQPNAALPVRTDERCFNGLFMREAGGTIPVVLQVDDASVVRHIELDDCAQSGRVGKLSFAVFDSDASTVLGMSSVPPDPGPNGTCASLDQDFPRNGPFSLGVVVEPGVTPAGDLSLRFY